ncbi:MAG: LytR/AlgR family response regulator transcription factor [bacterium]
MQKITAIIVDDEPLARQRIRDLLANEPSIEILAECADGHSAVEVILSKSPDLIFLDIQMPEMDGFEVVRRIQTTNMPVIIFATAFDQFAIRAFDVHALDYLLKPYDDERFAGAIARAREQIRQKQTGAFHLRLMNMLQEHTAISNQPHESNLRENYIDRFAVKMRGETILIKSTDVDYIEGEGVYVRLHSAGKACLLRERMAVLEKRLDPQRFFRIHRSTIVNLERIKKLVPHFHGDYIVVLQDGKQLKLSRSRRKNLQKLLGTAI